MGPVLRQAMRSAEARVGTSLGEWEHNNNKMIKHRCRNDLLNSTVAYMEDIE